MDDSGDGACSSGPPRLLARAGRLWLAGTGVDVATVVAAAERMAPSTISCGAWRRGASPSVR
jgi:hypothetical protein